jgi:hypothetical protein
MFQIQINGTPVVFSKFFGVGDKHSVLASIPDGTKRVVFIDTPSTPHLVGTIESLISRGIEVVVRDHHDVPSPRNPREQEIADAAARTRELVGGNATISNRAAHPACSGLIEIGEFAGEGTVIVADPDPDGLTAAMKAVGVVYDGIDADAAVLDGARSEQTAERLTPVAVLLVKGMATLPPFNAERPAVSEEAKGKLFAEFAAAATGDTAALESLGRKVLRGGCPRCRGPRGRSDAAGRGCGDGRRRGQAPARPRHAGGQDGVHPGLPRDRRPQGQRPHRWQARRGAGLPGGGEGPSGRHQPPGALAPGLRLLAGVGDHLEHHLPAPCEPGGVGYAGAPRAHHAARGVALRILPHERNPST